jgi:cell division protein ZapA (FtsZ GTPase activity inhibitor)
MTDKLVETNISLLGNNYLFKCSEDEVADLQQSAAFLDKQMRSIRDRTKGGGFERVAVLAALNIVNKLLSFEHNREEYLVDINQRLAGLNDQVDTALAQQTSWDFEEAV